MKEIWDSMNRYYFVNFSTIITVILSIFVMFFIQFNVEKLQENIAKSRTQINDFEDQIRLLEVEWVYLTRPERLRQISAKFLKNNGYALSSQIKGEDQLNEIYSADYKIDENAKNLDDKEQKI